MASFMAVGCGDDNNDKQKDAAAQHDAPIQDDAAPQEDAAPQKDAKQQDDAAPMSGLVAITQMSPQPVSAGIPPVVIPVVDPSWDPPAVGENPVAVKEEPGAMSGLGCFAARYKKSTGHDHATTTASAGNLTISGYTGGKIWTTFPGPLPDGGLAALPDLPSSISCAYEQKFDGDAGTGNYQYRCTPSASTETGVTPTFGFLTAGQKINFTASGSADVPAISATADGGALTVAPFAVPETNLFGLPMYVTDAGTVPINYNCGAETVADAGVQPCRTGDVLVIRVYSSDGMPPPEYGGLLGGDPVDEIGYLLCTVLITSQTNRSFTISKDLWETAFPANGQWWSMFTTIFSLSLNPVGAGGKTLVGVGGGYFGTAINPNVPDGGFH